MKALKKYRPKSLLSVVYKLSRKVLTNRITTTLDSNQPQVQAEFGSDYLTIDHIHVINQVVE